MCTQFGSSQSGSSQSGSFQGILVRAATIADVAAIAQVHVDAWRTTYAGILPQDFLDRLAYADREPQWQQILQAPAIAGNFVYVAENRAGQLVGFVSGGRERTHHAVYTGEIYALYILASDQRRGIGRSLMQTAMQQLAQSGLTAMMVWVLAANPARHFYAAMGGVPVAEQEIAIAGTRLLEIAYGWSNTYQ